MIRTLELRRKSRELAAEFEDGFRAVIPFDLLRARSPSAEAPPNPPRVGVDISALEPVGNYAVRPLFSDGHSAGIYSWDCLRDIAEEAAGEQQSAGEQHPPRNNNDRPAVG